jgi:hypothetical protein
VANADAIKYKAKGFIMHEIDRRTTRLGNVVGEHVSNLHAMGESLRGQGQDGTARLVDMAADRLTQVSLYLQQSDGNRIVHDIETLARNRPVVTAAAGFLFGVTAARLLKAGAVQRYRTYGDIAGSDDAPDADARIADTETFYGVR